ncbi:hypothetical protein [Streptomyces sp. NPDC093149]|uniref:hypothetical protein n=1 Tax=Streptomyces sp. NPDC093149 TaxID=3366031 RepID=UPI0037FA1440
MLTSLAVPRAMRWARDQRGLATACSVVLLVGYAGLFAEPRWVLLWTVVLGLGGGACLVLALAFISLRAQDAASVGGLSAMAQSVGYLLAAVGPVVFGLLHSLSSGRAPLLLMVVVAATQTVAALVAGRGMVAPAWRPGPELAAPAAEHSAPTGR